MALSSGQQEELKKLTTLLGDKLDRIDPYYANKSKVLLEIAVIHSGWLSDAEREHLLTSAHTIMDLAPEKRKR